MTHFDVSINRDKEFLVSNIEKNQIFFISRTLHDSSYYCASREIDFKNIKLADWSISVIKNPEELLIWVLKNPPDFEYVVLSNH